MKLAIFLLSIVFSTQILADINEKMSKEYSAYMSSTVPGDNLSWAGGTLTRTSTGATFTDSLGKTVAMPADNPDFNALAKANDSIAQKWKSQYGFEASGSEADIISELPKTGVTEQIDYLKAGKETSIKMLIDATEKYKNGQGTISKDEYVKVAQGVSLRLSTYGKLIKATPSSTSATPNAQPASLPAQPNTMRYNGSDITFDEYAKIVCGGNPQYVVCRPKEKRLQYVKDIIAKAKKPMPANWADSTYSDGHGEAAPEIYEASFANWKQVITKSVAVSCDEAVAKYNLFPNEKNKPGNWAADSNRNFSGIGSGGALISTSYYVDKATGEQMTEAVVNFEAIGFCHK